MLIFLPGFGGSKIYCACDPKKLVRLYPKSNVFQSNLCAHFFECKNTKTKVMKTTFGISVYKNFLKRIDVSASQQLKVFSYDWSRFTPLQIAEQLKRYLIENNFNKIFLVGHSMGGLVIRILIEYLNYTKNIKKVLICGTPLYGSVNYTDYNFEYNLYLAIVKNDISLVEAPFHFSNNDKKNFFSTFPNSVKYLMPTYTINGQCSVVNFDNDLKSVHTKLSEFKFPESVDYIFYYNYSRISLRFFTSLCNFQRHHPGNKLIFLKRKSKLWDKVIETRQNVFSDGLVTIPESVNTIKALFYFDSTFTVHSLMTNNKNIYKILMKHFDWKK